MKTVVTEEAYRKVTVREGEKVLKMSVVQAVMRSVSVSAAKGNTRAQRIFADLLRWVESDRASEALRILDTAIKYKNEMEDALGEQKARGITGWEPIPHPDDIDVDLHTGRVHFRGPLHSKQKEAQEEFLSKKPAVIKQIWRIEEALGKNPGDRELEAEYRKAQIKLARIANIERLSPGLVEKRKKSQGGGSS